MKIARAYLFKLNQDGQALNICETEHRQLVEFICEGGHFYLNKEEATKIAQIIDPNSFASERIRYRPDPDIQDYGKSYDEVIDDGPV